MLPGNPLACQRGCIEAKFCKNENTDGGWGMKKGTGPVGATRGKKVAVGGLGDDKKGNCVQETRERKLEGTREEAIAGGATGNWGVHGGG